MIFNEIITDIHLMNNPRIKIRYKSDGILTLKIDNVYMGVIIYSDNSVFYQDLITEGDRDIERREYFLGKLVYRRILRLKDPCGYGGCIRNIYKITGVVNE